jgi:hypothetical protein
MEHDVHIDELYRYNMGLTDGPVGVISMDEEEMLVDAQAVSLGQYYSTVRATHSPRVYIKIIISLGA